MTIAISMKINDGIILATDSSSTIFGKNEEGIDEVHHTYFTADKLFNIKKGSPIGVMTWGEGSINNESISTLIKDFRKESAKIDYVSVMDTSHSFKKFLEEKICNDESIGFLLAGYSNGGDQEIILINVDCGNVENPVELNKDDPLAILWFGDTDFITRYLLGFDERLSIILKNNNVDDDVIEDILSNCKDDLQLPLGVPAMPIQDAIDLVRFLADISVNSSRFVPGAQVIGGSIDIAVITKHEGFKWISRKHYYNQNLNITTGGK
jgi:hypothetical protein